VNAGEILARLRREVEEKERQAAYENEYCRHLSREYSSDWYEGYFAAAWMVLGWLKELEQTGSSNSG
jgi:hypothetical protein